MKRPLFCIRGNVCNVVVNRCQIWFGDFGTSARNGHFRHAAATIGEGRSACGG
jgi:hypothetical protein